MRSSNRHSPTVLHSLLLNTRRFAPSGFFSRTPSMISSMTVTFMIQPPEDQATCKRERKASERAKIRSGSSLFPPSSPHRPSGILAPPTLVHLVSVQPGGVSMSTIQKADVGYHAVYLAGVLECHSRVPPISRCVHFPSSLCPSA